MRRTRTESFSTYGPRCVSTRTSIMRIFKNSQNKMEAAFHHVSLPVWIGYWKEVEGEGGEEVRVPGLSQLGG